MTTRIQSLPPHSIHKKALISTILTLLTPVLLFSLDTQAAVSVHGVIYGGLHQPAEPLTRGLLNMSRDGRYILTNPTGESRIGSGIVDIKTQTTVALPTLPFFSTPAISPNGRYVSYGSATINNNYSSQVTDRYQQVSYGSNNHDEHLALSDNGFLASGNQNTRIADENKGAILNLATQMKDFLPNKWAGVSGPMYRTDWFSSDGKTTLYKGYSDNYESSHFYIYNSDTSITTLFDPLNAYGNSLFGNLSSSSDTALGQTNIALSSNGKYIAFTVPTGPIEHYIWRATVSPTGYTVQQFRLDSLQVKVIEGIAISSNGRFVSFIGDLLTGHPEFTSGLSPRRVFRYDSVLNKVVTVSVTRNGSPLRNRTISPAEVINFYPATNISDDGSIVQFATDADNILVPIVQIYHIFRKYYAVIDTDMPTRNYQFIHMQNSDSGAFAPMTLVANNSWEGKLSFNGIGTKTFKFEAGGRFINGIVTLNAANFGSGSSSTQAAANGANIVVNGGAGDYIVTFNDQTLKYTVTKQSSNPDWQRTVVMIYGQTQSGQDMFIRGGLDHQQALIKLNKNCDANNSLCSMPIRHLNKLNPTTAPWKQGDTKLDWQDTVETGQGATAKGSPLDWTTNFWPTSWGAKKTVAINGYGETPINLWGQHYWLLDVEMDCSKTYNGWFEVKSFISGGPGWESNINQPGAPWTSVNHFAQCGKLNVFKRGQNSPVTIGTF